MITNLSLQETMDAWSESIREMDRACDRFVQSSEKISDYLAALSS